MWSRGLSQLLREKYRNCDAEQHSADTRLLMRALDDGIENGEEAGQDSTAKEGTDMTDLAKGLEGEAWAI